MLAPATLRPTRRRLARAALYAFLIVGVCGAVRAAQYPAPTGHVNDFAGVMRQEAITQLETVLTELEWQTGAEVAVVTVKTVPDGSIEQAAVDLFQEWGVGKKGKDNGVLMLCAVQDRKVRIEVGYGLEPVLPDAECGRIIRDVMVPQFRTGDLSAGLVNGALAVAQIIAQQAGVTIAGTTPLPASDSRQYDWLVELLLFGTCLLIIIYLARRLVSANYFRWGGWYGSGGGFSSGGFGGGGEFSGGGFGGFGGGMSGGGGASGRW